MQNTCRAEGWEILSFVIEVIELAASVRTARMKKVALEQSSAHVVDDMGKLRYKLDETTLAVQVAKLRGKALKGQVFDQKGIVSKISEAVSSTTEAAAAFWWEN